MIRLKKNNPVVIFFAAVALLFFLHALGWIRPLESTFWYLVKPVSGRLYEWGAGISGVYDSNKNQADLNEQVARLTKEVADLTVANSQCRGIAEENDKLKAALKFGTDNKLNFVAANVIGKEAASDDGQGLIINRGSNDGLRTGLGVISVEGVIVGQIIDVKPATAEVCLTTSPNCQLAASLQNEDKTQGITDGDLGLTIKMNYIPQLEKVSPGDPVLTSGLGGNIPRGFVIGKVTKVYNASNEVWQEATIEPLVNFDNLTVVSVVKP